MGYRGSGTEVSGKPQTAQATPKRLAANPRSNHTGEAFNGIVATLCFSPLGIRGLDGHRAHAWRPWCEPPPTAFAIFFSL